MTSSRELLDTLGWTLADPRQTYDLAVFKVIEQLVREIEELRGDLAEVRGAGEATIRVLASRTDHLV